MQIKRMGYAPLRNWDAWERVWGVVGGGAGKLCLANLNIVILVSQQNRAFDVTCQVPLGLGGWSSPLVRQPAASSSESTEPETPTCVVGL